MQGRERERWMRQVRASRLRMGITQTDLALILSDRSDREVAQRDVSKWETGVRPIPEDIKLELIRVLSIDPRDVAPDWIRPLLARSAA